MSAAKGRAPIVHDLKMWPGDFAAVVDGRKTAEIRRCDDRAFRVGDVLTLREYEPTSARFTGQIVRVRVTHIDRMAGPLIVMGAHQGNEDGIPLALLSFGKIST